MNRESARDEASPARQILDASRKQLGAERVLTSPEDLARYAGVFWLRRTKGVSDRFPLGAPAGVVRPRNAGDVAEILRQAGAGGVPIVPYGAGTAVMGSTLPIQGSIVLDLGALNQVLTIEKENRLARVQPGVVLADLARAAEEHGLLFAHDPWSQPIATVGGAVGTNGMGYLAAGYGSMGQQVRGLTVVLADGTVVSWPGAAKTAVGPDLGHLFVGAEGTLGVIVEVVVQLFPWPERREFLAYRFPSFAEGFAAIVAMDALGLHPAMIDYEEEEGEPFQMPANLFLAFDGPEAVVRAAARRAKQICQVNDGLPRERGAARKFWTGRHESAEWFIQRVNGPRTEEFEPAPRVEWRYVDVAVPTDRVLDYCREVMTIADRNQVGVHSFGIWARPELVSFLLEGSNQPEREPEMSGRGGPLDRAMDEALTLARSEGGSIEYCHGVGVRLAHLLPIELGAGVDLLRRIKHALDPGDVLNPGKLGIE